MTQIVALWHQLWSATVDDSNSSSIAAPCLLWRRTRRGLIILPQRRNLSRFIHSLVSQAAHWSNNIFGRFHKKKFRPANGMLSTPSLVKLHNNLASIIWIVTNFLTSRISQDYWGLWPRWWPKNDRSCHICSIRLKKLLAKWKIWGSLIIATLPRKLSTLVLGLITTWKNEEIIKELTCKSSDLLKDFF